MKYETDVVCEYKNTHTLTLIMMVTLDVLPSTSNFGTKENTKK